MNRFKSLAQKAWLNACNRVATKILVGKIIHIEDGPEMKEYKVARAVQEEDYLDIYTDPHLWK